jgi:excisionase family DNA binding protein
MKYYTIDEVAKIYKLNRKTVRREIEKGHLKAKLVAGRWRIEETNLKNWDDRNNSPTPENATTVSGHSDQDTLSSSQPDTSMPQAEIEPGSADTSEESNDEDAGIEQEKVKDEVTVKNAEKLAENWNLYSPFKEPLTPEGHLLEPMKHKVEKFMVENDNDLKQLVLTIRILFYLYDKNLIRGKITLKQFIRGDYQVRLGFPKLTPAEDTELEGSVRRCDIWCFSCGRQNEIFNPDGKMECPHCNETEAVYRLYPLIVYKGMAKYPVLQIFYKKYGEYLVKSMKKVWARAKGLEKQSPPGIHELKTKDFIKGDKTLDWAIIADIYKMKREVYDQQ